MAFKSSITKIAAVLAVLILIIAVAGGGAVALDRPQIDRVESDWGTVTQERTEIQTRITVDNPRIVKLADATLNVEYTVSLNDIKVADGQKGSVELSGRRNVVEISTWLNNSDIPRWWASHVNNNETTTVTVNPTVETAFIGMHFGAASLTRKRTVQTNLLKPLNVNRTQELHALNRTVLYVNETQAQWGNATVERTPINASATVTNPLPVPLPITNLTYTIRMNGIVVGHGQAGNQTIIPSKSTETINAHAVIDNQKLDEWWVSHRRNGGTSEFTITFNATVSVNGNKVRLPLTALSYNRTFSTHLLGGPAENSSQPAAINSTAPSTVTKAPSVGTTDEPNSIAV
ncbi:hypothetical protein DMJ13_20415 [halophilic archaeon]|nr:hypothetical protein DMJ13_20415 [halophilic archaeon]